MMLGEPLLIYAEDPSTCSQIVAELLDITKPFTYFANFRPYYTINNEDLCLYTNKNLRPPQNIILGLTNPNFKNLFENWPHWIIVSSATGNKKKLKLMNTTFKFNLTPQNRLYNKIKNSQSLFEKIELVRIYFSDLNNFVNTKLNEYYISLLPVQKISRSFLVPETPVFDTNNFLEKIATFELKPFNKRFFKKFVKTNSFFNWLKNRQLKAKKEIAEIYIRTIKDLDIDAWVQDKSEVEIVDLITKLKEAKCKFIKEKKQKNDESLDICTIENKILKLTMCLSSDLKEIMRSDSIEK